MKDHPANSPPSKDRPLAYRFGPFILHGGERVLRREDGQIVALRPKAFETLLALVEKSGHVLSKDELMERIWPETFVEESGLARKISCDALKRSPRAPFRGGLARNVLSCARCSVTRFSVCGRAGVGATSRCCAKR